MRHAGLLLALPLLCSSAAPAAQTGQALRIAVLRDAIVGFDLSSVDSAAAAMRGAGFSVALLSMEQMGSAAQFGAGRFDALVLSQSHHFTAAARENLFAFLKSGGDLILLRPDGFLQPNSLTLPAFSRYEPYEFGDAVSVVSWSGQNLLAGIKAEGQFGGRSAIGFTRRAAAFTPLLDALDRYGRHRGWACGLLSHFAEYEGSDWLLFGLSTPLFYGSSAFTQTLLTMLPKMKSNQIAQEAKQMQERALAARLRVRSPMPGAFIRLSEDKRHLLLPGGKRFFMVGLNYHRSIDAGEWWKTPIIDGDLDDDFRKAREAGVNCIRLGTAPRFYEDADLVKEAARKHGIYLLILLNWGTRQDFVENAEKVARIWADEPMVLGYDLQNEPTAGAVSALLYDGGKSPVMKLLPDLRDRAAVDKLWGEATNLLTRGSGSTFPGVFQNFTVAPEHVAFTRAYDETLKLYLAKHIEAIRKHDKNHLISLGYNSIQSILPANSQLDFVSQHVYDRPFSYETVMTNITTMDRLARVWPNQPITLGEFGYSNGIAMPDGRYLDFHTSAVGEMMHWLYAMAKGYDGCMKWVLTDWHWDVIGKAGDRGRATQIYEAYFGTHYWDGNASTLTRPKPVAHGMRFLREYADRFGPGGAIQILRGPTTIGAVYRFTAPNALFIGDVSYSSPGLDFNSIQPSNVMAFWSGGEMRLLATADTTVKLAIERFLPSVSAVKAKIAGRYGSARVTSGRLVIEALAGEALTIR